jgi:putative transposase
MAIYHKASHVTYDCRYHIVWITKFRRKVLTEAMHARLATILAGVAKDLYISIIRMGFEDDHVHLYVAIPHTQHIPYVAQMFKGRTSKILRQEFEGHLKKFYWKPFLWAVGYFIATVGEVNHETIARYVEEQGRKEVLGDDETVDL